MQYENDNKTSSPNYTVQCAIRKLNSFFSEYYFSSYLSRTPLWGERIESKIGRTRIIHLWRISIVFCAVLCIIYCSPVSVCSHLSQLVPADEVYEALFIVWFIDFMRLYYTRKAARKRSTIWKIWISNGVRANNSVCLQLPIISFIIVCGVPHFDFWMWQRAWQKKRSRLAFCFFHLYPPPANVQNNNNVLVAEFEWMSSPAIHRYHIVTLLKLIKLFGPRTGPARIYIYI